ncbi:MAG: nucleoside kinase [Spirochaetales bacterium]|nr:nucleoside kinase [Spirochaetales bacterium]MBR1582872.1 nucleoside kinase [Spirochaetales bacterium]
MREIVSSVEGKKYRIPAFSSAREILEKAGMALGTDYQENPIVAALINGRLSPLGTPVPMSCPIEPVRAFQGFGRRVYRHSLCFLLCYASKLVFPKRRLVIGHSLGDGFFFNYEDAKDTDKDQIEALSAKMKELVEQKLDIEYVSLSNQDAIKALKKQGYEDAVLLLKSMNAPSVDLYKLQEYCQIAYEPIVDNTSVLGVWDLRPYENGMLLRYPVKESIHSVVQFKDNQKLFEVFNEYRAWGKILGVSYVGEMNRMCSDNTAEQYVRLSEALQRRKIASIADDIHNRKAKAVFIAGPSSSGKTTFAKKLCEQLLLMEYSPIKISLDDYYKQRQYAPLDEEGKPDFEALEALDTDMFDRNMHDLFAGQEVDLPHFSFTENATYYLNKPIKMNSHTIFVIEGIHGLNPKIVSKIEPKYVYKVYISALTQLNMDDCNRVSTTDDRMLRRILRDYRTRGSSAEETLLMWPSVSRGERVHIFPNQNNADVMFNSALDYELGVLSPFVAPLLHEVSPDSGTAYTHAQRLLAFLENIYAIPSSFVPSDSILREFIGESDYED